MLGVLTDRRGGKLQKKKKKPKLIELIKFDLNSIDIHYILINNKHYINIKQVHWLR